MVLIFSVQIAGHTGITRPRFQRRSGLLFPASYPQGEQLPPVMICVLGDFCEVLLRFGPVSLNCLIVLGSQPLAVALIWVPSESPGELAVSFDSGGLVWSPRVCMSEKSSGGGSSCNISFCLEKQPVFFPPTVPPSGAAGDSKAGE